MLVFGTNVGSCLILKKTFVDAHRFAKVKDSFGNKEGEVFLNVYFALIIPCADNEMLTFSYCTFLKRPVINICNIQNFFRNRTMLFLKEQVTC